MLFIMLLAIILTISIPIWKQYYEYSSLKRRYGVSLKDEIRLLRTYLYNKMAELDKTMKGLLKYCREDLERLDKISKLIDHKNKNDANVSKEVVE